MKRKLFLHIIVYFYSFGKEGEECTEEEMNKTWKSLTWDERFKFVAQMESIHKAQSVNRDPSAAN